MINFNTRTPRGVRPHPSASRRRARRRFQHSHPAWGASSVPSCMIRWMTFQHSHPAWGASPATCSSRSAHTISTLAPRVGCVSIIAQIFLRNLFNSNNHAANFITTTLVSPLFMERPFEFSRCEPVLDFMFASCSHRFLEHVIHVFRQPQPGASVITGFVPVQQYVYARTDFGASFAIVD